MYRWAAGERPCRTHLIAFLVAMAALVAIYQEAVAPLGLADPPLLTAAVALVGIAVAARILLRADGPKTEQAASR